MRYAIVVFVLLSGVAACGNPPTPRDQINSLTVEEAEALAKRTGDWLSLRGLTIGLHWRS